jgi:hypothetical protein
MPLIYYGVARVSSMLLRSAEAKNSILTLMIRLISKLKEKLQVNNRATKCWKVRLRVKQVLLHVDGRVSRWILNSAEVQ